MDINSRQDDGSLNENGFGYSDWQTSPEFLNRYNADVLAIAALGQCHDLSKSLAFPTMPDDLHRSLIMQEANNCDDNAMTQKLVATKEPLPNPVITITESGQSSTSTILLASPQPGEPIRLRELFDPARQMSLTDLDTSQAIQHVEHFLTPSINMPRPAPGADRVLHHHHHHQSLAGYTRSSSFMSGRSESPPLRISGGSSSPTNMSTYSQTTAGRTSELSRFSMSFPATASPSSPSPTPDDIGRRFLEQDERGGPTVEDAVYTQPRRKKARVTNVERKAICIYSSTHAGVTQETVAARYGVERSTISKIVKEKERWLSTTEEESVQAIVRHRPSKFPTLEQQMIPWLVKMGNARRTITDRSIRYKAQEIAEGLNIDQRQFKASSGWIDNFKRRHNIKKGMYRVGGGEESVRMDDEGSMTEDKGKGRSWEEEEGRNAVREAFGVIFDWIAGQPAGFASGEEWGVLEGLSRKVGR